MHPHPPIFFGAFATHVVPLSGTRQAWICNDMGGPAPW